MANQLKGEARFTYDGADYTLVYGAEALLQIEDELDMGMFALFDYLKAAEKNARDVKVGTLATILQCGLTAHHPDQTRVSAALMLLSGDEAVQTAIGQAITLMLPQPKDPGARPPLPAARPTTPAKPRAKPRKNGPGRKR